MAALARREEYMKMKKLLLAGVALMALIPMTSVLS
jgi:hypothetical protein